MKTRSNVYPLAKEYLQGKLLVAFNVSEIATEEGTEYEYSLLKLPSNSTDMHIEDAITAYQIKEGKGRIPLNSTISS
jgi:hypothetical protein